MDLLRTLVWLLFGSIFGWWILFIIGAVIVGALRHRVRAWVRSRRYMGAQASKLANPQNADVRMGLAEIYLQGRRWKKAERYAREAIATAKDNPLYDGRIPYAFHTSLATALYGRRRYAEAEASFRDALASPSQTGYHEALLGLAKSLYRLKRCEEALDFARHAANENTSSLETYFRWAQAAAALGRGDEVGEARRRFHETARALPPFSRERRLRFRLAFAFFGLARRVG